MDALAARFAAKVGELCPKGLIVAAVSGGGDSLALLYLLREIDREVVVAHLDHGLRRESAADARFVQDVAAKLGFRCVVERVDAAAIARRRRENMEASARRLRYSFLVRVAREYGAECVMTAHTIEDNAETVLLQLFRGAARALGIRRRRGRVVRPLLEERRNVLRAYLRSKSASWLEDPSNESLSLDRNYLRHQVWPRVVERFPRADAALLRYSLSQQADDDALEVIAAAKLVEDARFAPVRAVRGKPLLLAAPALRRRALRLLLEEQGIRPETRHIEAAERALQGETVSLQRFILRLTAGSLVWIPERPDLLTQAKAPAGLPVRTARAGDALRLRGMRKRLVDFLAERAVPPELRRVWPVAEKEGEVVWVWRYLPEDDDYRFMREALSLARRAADAGEVPVGALVVWRGKVVARVANESEARRDATAHAEMLALREALAASGEKVLAGATLYVTLEPCPMCMGALIEAQFSRVVWATENDKAGAVTRYGMPVPLQLEAGRFAKESARLLKGFFAKLREPKS